MDFSVFDNSFDVVLEYNSEGVILHANSSFFLFTGLSVARVIGKLTLDKVFLSFDEIPLNIKSFVGITEPKPMKLVAFRTRSVEKGIGQYSLSPFGDKFLMFFKDVTVEEELHKKYRREMSLKDKKIEEMNSLIELLQNTRMVKEPTKILEEFIKHVLSQFSLGVGFLKTPSTEVLKVGSSEYKGTLLNLDKFERLILKMPIHSKYEILDTNQLNEAYSLDFLKGLVIIPLQVQTKETYEVFMPFYSTNEIEFIDHQKVQTLSEQMKLLIQNMNLERLSIFDDLTKLHNSRYFRDKLNEFTTRNELVNLVLLDIDFFKKVNDTYGHPGGDAVLVQVGQILAQCSDIDVVAARVGGEEFAILTSNHTLDETLDIATQVSQKIKAAAIQYGEKVIKVTCSMGISKWNLNQMAVRDFYKQADEALYESKVNGRDRITVK